MRKKKKSKKEKDHDELPWVTPDEDKNEESSEYDDMTPKELYKLCKERDLEVEPKKPAAFYINLLKEDDKAHEDWDDEDEDDEDWDEESEDEDDWDE